MKIKEKINVIKDRNNQMIFGLNSQDDIEEICNLALEADILKQKLSQQEAIILVMEKLFKEIQRYRYREDLAATVTEMAYLSDDALSALSEIRNKL